MGRYLFHRPAAFRLTLFAAKIRLERVDKATNGCYNNIAVPDRGNIFHDPLAQLAEHLTFNQRVRSSNLRWITKEKDRSADWSFSLVAAAAGYPLAALARREKRGPPGPPFHTFSPAYSNHQNWRHTAGRGAFSAAEAPKTQEALMAFKFLGQRQLGKLPSRWVSTILMVAIGKRGFH